MRYYTTLDCLRLALIMGLGFLSKKITVLAAGRRWHSGDESRLVNLRPAFDSSWCQLFFNLKKRSSVMFASCMKKQEISHGQKQCLVMLSIYITLRSDVNFILKGNLQHSEIRLEVATRMCV